MGRLRRRSDGRACGEATGTTQLLIDANIFIDDALMRRGSFRLLLE